MRRVLLAFAMMAVAVLMGAGVASAITYGQPDGNRHPNVGGSSTTRSIPTAAGLYCSGTLISPTVFLTAAHCGDDGTTVGVTFDPTYEDGDKTYTGTFYADPAYPGPPADSHDIAVVVFDKPIKGIKPAKLPKRGLAVVACRATSVHLGRIRGVRGDQRAGRPPVPLRRRATVRRPDAQRHQQDLAAHLA